MTEPRLLFTVFVPGKVRRQDNGSQGSWKRKAGYRKAWKQRVQAHLLQHAVNHLGINPTTPKTVRLRARTFNLFDDDGLYAALKPVVDQLVSSGVINSDKPLAQSGHLILRSQQIDRALEGVLIEVREGVDLQRPTAGLSMETYEALKGSD